MLGVGLVGVVALAVAYALRSRTDLGSLLHVPRSEVAAAKRVAELLGRIGCSADISALVLVEPTCATGNRDLSVRSNGPDETSLTDARQLAQPAGSRDADYPSDSSRQRSSIRSRARMTRAVPFSTITSAARGRAL